MSNIINKIPLDQIIQRLVQEFNPEKIILFGSYAWGNPNENSDLDLLVIIPHSDIKPIQRAINAYRCLGGFENIPKDILVKTHQEAYKFKNVIGSLENVIFKKGKVLYSGTKTGTS
jgi:predicted nucleotidyltransferase